MTPFKVRRGIFLDVGDFIQGKGEFLSGFWKSGDSVQAKESQSFSGFWKYLVTPFKVREGVLL